MKLRFILLISIISFFVSCEENTEEAGPSAQACFDYAPKTEIMEGDEVSFTNCAENASEFSWDFGDGNTSTEENPTHVYENSGEFQVRLTVSNESSTDAISMSLQVEASEPEENTGLCRLESITSDEEEEEFVFTYDENERVSQIAIGSSAYEFVYNSEGILLEIISDSDFLGFEVEDGKISRKLLYEEGKDADPTVEEVYTYDEQGRITQVQYTDLYNDATPILYTYDYTESGEVQVHNDQNPEFTHLEFDENERPYGDLVGAFLFMTAEDLLGYPLPGINGNLTRVTDYQDADIEKWSYTISNTYENERLSSAHFLQDGENNGMTLSYGYGCY